MATSSEDIRVKLLDARKAETELRSVRKELEHTTGATERSGKASREAAHHHGVASKAIDRVGRAALYAGSYLGFYGLAEGVKSVVEGGAQATAQHALLQNALQATGQTGHNAYSQINAAIEKSTTHGGFGKLEETEGIAKLVRETGSYTTSIRENAAAVTLARGTHEDYATALTQIQRLETGTPGRLTKLIGPYVAVKYYVDQLTASQKKRYPALVKEAELKDKEATALQINQRLQERYGTAVKAYNDSAAGAMSNANNAFKNAEEELGEKLAPTIATVAKAFGEVVTEASKGEGIWKTVGKDAEVLWHALKGTWEFFEKNNAALKVLEGVLIGGGVLMALEKVSQVYKSIAGLSILGGAGEGAALGGVAPYLAIGAAALFAAHELHLFGENLTNTNKLDKAAHKGTILGLSSHQQIEEKRARDYLAHPFMAAKGISGLSDRNRQWLAEQFLYRSQHVGAFSNAQTPQAQAQAQGEFLAGAGTAEKIELHVDGTKMAEVIRRNPRAAREIAEAVAGHVLKKKARE